MSVIVEEVIRKLPDPHVIFPSFGTPYTKYCNTNYAAWGDDIPAIRQILPQQQQIIDDLDAIIKAAKNVLSELRKKRDRMLSSKRAHEGFISSGIRRLPSEILREIFLLCLPPEVYIEPRLMKAPMLLTRVCRRWREIAHSMPSLWCSLSFCQYRLEQPTRKRWIYHHWLSNARGSPLSLEAVVLNLDPSWRTEVIQLVQPYTTRCQELNIQFGTLLPDILLKDVPVLKRLVLEGDMRAFENTQSISIVQPQPCLHTLIISTPAFRLSTFNPGWTNLTHLSADIRTNGFLDSGDDHIFFTLLQVCTNLEHFIFATFYFQSGHPISLTHPKLRSLAIVIYPGHSPLETLTLPNLCDLQVESCIGPGDLAQPAWMASAGGDIEGWEMLSVPPPSRICRISHYGRDPWLILSTLPNLEWSTLTHLVVEVHASEHMILMLLQLCPNLESLVIDLMEDDDASHCLTHVKLHSLAIEVIGQRQWAIFDVVTLPNLCHLSIAVSTYFPHEKLQRFLSRSGCSLESLRLVGVENKEEVLASVKALMPTLEHLVVI